ncbi:hypothetical protein [Parasitella parasitica]|uniref:Uncharacterized protein n=1 Tax=Parasitella parasitica TaxID=35722 RepID=A0A0B7MWG2_9FUNG|nr:hypothetical protein [Parasitella parasitica]
MVSTKRKPSSICLQCSSRIERYIINTDCEISMCENVNCSYPFNEQSGEGLNIETPNTSFIRYSKINSKASSLSNTVASPTPDDNNNAKSAKKARTSLYKPASSSSSEKKQKDKLNLTKSSTLGVNEPNKHVASVTLTRASKADLHINTFTQANEQSRVVSTTSFTPPPETDYQESKSSASSATASTSTSPITVAFSPSSSTTSKLFDFALPSPTSIVYSESLSSQLDSSELPERHDPVITELLNYYADITQKTPPPRPPAVKSSDITSITAGLCLPPIAAAKVASVPASNTPSVHDYTLGDIESLLSVDIVNPPLQNNSQIEELSWMEDYTDLFL